MAEFHTEIQLFNKTELDDPLTLSEIDAVVDFIEEHEPASYEFLEIIFVDKKEIVSINKNYLGREYVTDTISFLYNESAKNINIEGTIILCLPKIYDQSSEYNESHKSEIYRVLIHSLLHLAGYSDTTPEQQKRMTQKENYYLSLVKK